MYIDENGTKWKQNSITLNTRHPISVRDLPPFGFIENLTEPIGFQNRTKDNATLLIYNRVAKCGSTTMMTKIGAQSKRTNK